MKRCTYCGRTNPDDVTICPGCGTDALNSEAREARRAGRAGRWPDKLIGWCSLGLRALAFAVVLQGLTRCAYTPLTPDLGEGNFQTAAAEYHLFACAFAAVILFALGGWLKGVNRKDER